MIPGLLRLAATAASLFILAGFVLFVVSEGSSASERQQGEVVTPGADPAAPATSQKPSGLRGTIERVNGLLLAPFAVGAENAWVANGVPTLLGLLVYGVGLGFLARFIEARS